MKVNSELIQDLLRKRNWSERKLAFRTGLSQATISRVLNGKRGAGVKTFSAFQRVFPEIPAERLFLFCPNATEWEGMSKYESIGHGRASEKL